jgi:hypothetical protein
MPKAVATQQTKRFELKTLPEGFVELRKLNYGEVLKRREMSQQMDFAEAEDGRPKGTFVMDMDGVAIFEFNRSIVSHNLTDENDQPLNFTDPQHVMWLDSAVAQEIETLITQLNQFDADLRQDVPFSGTSTKPSELKEDESKSVVTLQRQ